MGDVLSIGDACFGVLSEFRGTEFQTRVSESKGLHQGHMIRNRNRVSLLKKAKAGGGRKGSVVKSAGCSPEGSAPPSATPVPG